MVWRAWIASLPFIYPSCVEKGAVYFIEKLTEQSLFWDAELDAALSPSII